MPASHMHSPTPRSRRGDALWILLAALAALSPMLVRGFSCGNDLTFHMQSWMEAARHWRVGELLPRWVESAAWGAGEPRFIFYPLLSWLLGGLLGVLAGWRAAPFLFALVALCGAGWAMRSLARQWLSGRAALLAACLYVANPYTLFVLYTRAAMAELLAAAFIPWLLAEALRPRIRVWALALAVAALWLSNAPAAVMACYALALLLLVRAMQQRSVANLLQGAAGTLLGIMLAAGYILPAAYERRWVSISQVVSGAYDFHANFLFGGMGDPLHDLVLRHASWIAVVLLAVAIPAGAFPASRTRAGAGVPLLALSVTILFLLLPVSGLVWAYLPQLRFLQFPWRFLALLAPVAAFSAAAVLDNRRRAFGNLAVAAACVCSIAMCYSTLRQECDPEDTPRGIRAQFLGGDGFEGTDEYVPIGADPDDLRPDPQHPGYPRVWLYRDESPEAVAQQPESEDEGDDDAPSNAPEEHVRMASTIDVTAWQPEHKVFRVHASRKAIALLQLEDYPAWAATLDGHRVAKAPPATSGQMQLAIPEGDHTVEVTFAETRDRLLGDALSAFGFVLLLVAFRRRGPDEMAGAIVTAPVLSPAVPAAAGAQEAASAPVSSNTDAG